MTNRAKQMRAVDRQLRDLRTDEPSALAALYLAPLTRLLELSSDFDDILRDDYLAWKKTTVRARCILSEEKERLGLIDRAVQNFLRCVGGSGEFVLRAQLRMKEQVTHSERAEALLRYALGGLVFLRVQ